MADLINKEEFEALVLKNDKPVMVDLFATWCGPCKMISPFVEEVKGELEGEAEVFKVDIDKNEELCEEYSVSAVPTLLFFKNGKCVDRIVGGVDKEVMAEKLKSLI